MEESGNVREIEVRSLAGESVRVWIEPNKTVQDLKLLLRKCFSPASSSSNFHLFLKGVKLKLQSRICSYEIGDGDFLVITPFLKKGQQQMQGVDVRTSENTERSECLETELAESAWVELMEDLSSLRGDSNIDISPEAEMESVNNETHDRRILEKTRAVLINDRDKGNLDDMLKTLQKSRDILDEQSFPECLEFMDSSSCLNDPATGSCVMRKANDSVEVDPCTSDVSLCHCPPWLKDLMKTFCFLDIYSACFQLSGKRITIRALEEALAQLHKFGFQTTFADLELLSEVCPQVIHFVSNAEGFKYSSAAITILKFSEGKHEQHEDELISAVKKLSRSTIIHLMKKREVLLKTILSKAVKSLMFSDGMMKVKYGSLEDLVLYMKKNDATVEIEAKQGRGRDTAAPSCRSYEVLCHETNSLLPEEMVGHLKSSDGYQGQVVHIEEIIARNANYVEIPCQLSEGVKSTLNRMGITKLYSHQAESIKASLAGNNVIVATMTSSGKSLCYNVPVLEVLSNDILACALYLFPTKALAQDQLRALSAMAHGIDDSLSIGIYDGDTSQEDRLRLRDNARLLITNPDMLHVSILPCHRQFSRILSHLRFVVIDEAHAYKGAFGCHAALIFRRLRRICSHVYGSDPSFIFSTATSANPREHAMELANLPTIELIENDGSPSGLKLFMLWNPPLCLKTVWKRMKTSLGAKKSVDKKVVAGRSSPILEIAYLFAEMIQHGLRCIAFCKTRKLCELVLCYTREILHQSAPHLVSKISAYRAGYIAEDRRRIESDIFTGNICGIAATNALELGIDVGHIDITLHLGFPGSISSLWQQAGRSGRRGKPSLAVYVAFEGPLDQYFMKFPHKLFKGLIECCHVDAKNEQVLQQHLSCAALEHPLSLLHDEKYFGSGLERAIMTLKNKGCLSADPSRDSAARIWTYIGHEKSPPTVVNVRAIETTRYKVIDELRCEVLEEIEESRAFFQVYEGAVYMNQGKTYLVKHLDLSSKIAWCREADLNYYTKTRDYTDIHVIGSHIAYPVRIANDRFTRTTAQTHICKVTTTWFGFRRIWKRSNQVFDSVELSLPDFSYESQAAWIRVPQSLETAVETLHYPFRGGLHAIGHAILNVVPLFITCNQSDLASECANPHDARYFPVRILLYDPRPGGTGISAKVQPVFTELLTAALELLTSCHCSGDTGCPNCVQNVACREYNEVLHKNAAIVIIEGILAEERSHFEKNAEFPKA